MHCERRCAGLSRRHHVRATPLRHDHNAGAAYCRSGEHHNDADACPGGFPATPNCRPHRGCYCSTVPEAASAPQPTVSVSDVASSGSARATLTGDTCTATGRFPAGAGPFPCSQ